MSDKNEIIWRREPSILVHLDYVSACGRWRIIHPKNCPENRWILLDGAAEKPWRGDHLSLNTAKRWAYQLQRVGK